MVEVRKQVLSADHRLPLFLFLFVADVVREALDSALTEFCFYFLSLLAFVFVQSLLLLREKMDLLLLLSLLPGNQGSLLFRGV